MGDSRHMTRTITIQKTQTEMDYPSAPSAGASSATKELDDLMASLSDFKVSKEPYACKILLAEQVQLSSNI